MSVDEVMRGRPLPGRKVLLLDRNGHWESCGTAEFLMEGGHEVHLITPLAAAGIDLEPSNSALFYQRVRRRGGMRIGIHLDLKSIAGRQVILVDVHSGEEEVVEEVDAIVLSIGRRSNDALYHALPQGKTVHRIGDCLAPRFLQHAIVEGDAVGRALGEAAA